MMNQTQAPEINDASKPPALSRTWRVFVEYRAFGEFWGNATYEVTLRREYVGGQLTATVDAQPASLRSAINILDSAATFEVLDEVLSDPTTPVPLTMPALTIGKARAQSLHKIMGALGIPHAKHYGVAAFAIDEPLPLGTLSDLSEQEAGRVWAHLTRTYPNAREVAQHVKAKAARAAA